MKNNASRPASRLSRDEIDWKTVDRVLVVKLRSIGDTVLSTPSLIALRRFLPDAQIDILLEDWVAPVLDGFDGVDKVLTVGKSSRSRLRTAWDLRRRRYDVVFNLHGGTTAAFFAVASGARHRVGVASYQYAFLYNHLLSSASDYWQRRDIHSAEQQLALLGFAGVPVDDLPMSRLSVTPEAHRSLEAKFVGRGLGPLDGLGDYALVHPTAAFATKQWATANFALASEYLFEKGVKTIAIAAPFESAILRELESASQIPIISFNDLTLPEITVLAGRAKIFVGNDSGIAHIAAAVNTPSVVIFGSSSRTHWRPWTVAPYEVVYEEWPCQPCAGYTCEVFGEPKCILSVTPDAAMKAIESLLDKD